MNSHQSVLKTRDVKTGMGFGCQECAISENLLRHLIFSQSLFRLSFKLTKPRKVTAHEQATNAMWKLTCVEVDESVDLRKKNWAIIRALCINGHVRENSSRTGTIVYHNFRSVTGPQAFFLATERRGEPNTPRVLVESLLTAGGSAAEGAPAEERKSREEDFH